jgi:hypothetical protein
LPLQRLCKVEKDLEDKNKKEFQRDKKTPWSLYIGTFRKFLFILCSRRPEGSLLVNQKKMGITGP